MELSSEIEIEIMGNRCSHDDEEVVTPGGREVENNGEDGDKRTDENEERGNWTGKMDFILSLLGWVDAVFEI